MAENPCIVIVLRKRVPDNAAGQAIFELVKAKLADRPDIIITGQITDQLTSEPEEPT